jgi:outer membrane protein assembly factor BamB
MTRIMNCLARLNSLALFALLALIATNAMAGDWPQWRGPDGTGHSDEKGVPLRWSKTDNIAWKIPLAETGNSTPIVYGDKVFITGTRDEGKTRALICFSRVDGKELWSKGVEYTEKDPSHKTNPFCSSSPVTDGKRIVVWHGSAGLFCYDMSGKELWQMKLGKFEHIWGYAASPIIYKDLVIASCGPGLTSFVAAFNKDTGEEVWRIAPKESQSLKVEEFRGSWSTPVVYKDGDRDVILMSLPMHLYALEPATGKTVWKSGGLSKLVYTSPLTSPSHVVAMSGYHGPAICIRPGGNGDVTEDNMAWTHVDRKMNPQRVGSGIIVGNHIYILNETGMAWCLDLTTGEKLWEQRLGGKSWSSMAHVDGRLYVNNMDGKTFVLKPTPEKCEVLAENELGELTRGSLAFSNGQIFVRTYKHLYCIGKP